MLKLPKRLAVWDIFFKGMRSVKKRSKFGGLGYFSIERTFVERSMHKR